MANLKNSIIFLFFYQIMIFGIAGIRYIEENVINFSPLFFVLIGLSVLSGLIILSVFRISIYSFLMLWSGIYGLAWAFYWRVQANPLNAQVLGIQFLLVMISAGLAYDVGRQLDNMNNLFEGLSASTYPNRTLEIQKAEDRISAELTRSRRYHHPLSLMLVTLDENAQKDEIKSMQGLQRDLLKRFAVARVGQIISERARETDLILRDRKGRFLLLCPETTAKNTLLFGERIRRAVAENVGADVLWSFASFPDDALTFEDLVEYAEHRLDQMDALYEQAQAQEREQEILV